ncbi:MAG: cobalt ECF transporter T component CbiQ [Dehalococcoidia bacterium]|nr:cobalt ECF transporter T component CbiQ [Dehalococcoidia bacterium]
MCQGCDVAGLAGASQAKNRAWLLVSHVSPYTKLAVLGAGLLVNLVSSSLLTSLALAAGSLAVLLFIGTEPGLLAKRLVAPWYLAVVAVGTQVFLTGNTIIFQWGPLTGYAEGLIRGELLGGRIVGGAALVLCFSLTMSVTELLSLASRLRLSPVLIEIASLTYRYLFLLSDEGQRIREAQLSRLGHNSWRKSMRSYGVLAGMLMARSYDKAEGVYQAMASRGYRGTLPTENCRTPGARDVLGLGVALILMGVAFWAGTRYGL